MSLLEPVMREAYERLAVLFGGSLESLPETAKSISAPYMDAHFDRLRTEGGSIVVALAHYYRVNGDSVSDPDMELRIDLQARTVEALTYQDAFKYQRVYSNGVPDRRLQLSLNAFLVTWLGNLLQQGHCFRSAP